MIALDLLKIAFLAAAAGVVVLRLWRQLFMIAATLAMALICLGVFEAYQIAHHLAG